MRTFTFSLATTLHTSCICFQRPSCPGCWPCQDFSNLFVSEPRGGFRHRGAFVAVLVIIQLRGFARSPLQLATRPQVAQALGPLCSSSSRRRPSFISSLLCNKEGLLKLYFDVVQRFIVHFSLYGQPLCAITVPTRSALCTPLRTESRSVRYDQSRQKALENCLEAVSLVSTSSRLRSVPFPSDTNAFPSGGILRKHWSDTDFPFHFFPLLYRIKAKS